MAEEGETVLFPEGTVLSVDLSLDDLNYKTKEYMEYCKHVRPKPTNISIRTLVK